MKTNRVQVKLVVFPTNKNEWNNNYCSYCPVINYPFGRADSIEKVVADVQSQLLKLLCHREIYKNLQKFRLEDYRYFNKSSYFYGRRSCQTY